MSYKTVLPDVFPITITVIRDVAQKMVAELVTTTDEYPNGSSFAVTTDTLIQGYVVVWLSSTSADRINKSGILKQD